MNIFQFKDYRSYIKQRLEQKKGIFGYRTRLAKAIGCHKSYLSQILSGSANMTLDQVANLSFFWDLSDDETDYFLDLVISDRVGSNALTKIVQRRMSKKRQKQFEISKRMGEVKSLPENDQSIYYSNWYWSAIHVLVSIPSYNNLKEISERLGLEVHLVQKVLGGLKEMGLVKKKKDQWTIRENELFLPKASAFNTMNHLNWRQRALFDLQQAKTDSIHYTNVHALSKNDCEKFYEEVLKCLEKTKEIVRPSNEEEMICFTCDVFRV